MSVKYSPDNDIDYITNHIERLSEEDLHRLLRIFYKDLDLYNARKENKNVGTYLYFTKELPESLLYNIRKFIESNIKMG